MPALNWPMVGLVALTASVPLLAQLTSNLLLSGTNQLSSISQLTSASPYSSTSQLTSTSQLSATSLSTVPILPLNHYLFGDFIQAQGVVLSSGDEYWSGIVQSTCNCRTMCWSHTVCMAFSTEPQNGQLLCRLASKGPTSSTLQLNETGIYTFWTKSVPHIVYRMEEDGFLYVIPNFNHTWDYAKAICEKIPGHRLGMYHTNLLYTTLVALAAETGIELWADLFSLNGIAVWGNGVPFVDSEISRVPAYLDSGGDHPLRFKFSHFNDLPRELHRFFACQANPLGKDW